LSDFLGWIQSGLQSIGAGLVTRFHQEPVLVNAFLRSIVVLGTAFWLDWSPEQIGATYIVIESLTSLVSRQSVTPNVNL
jgi:hypothetical protein